jgi:PAS domain S-box-containing protein
MRNQTTRFWRSAAQLFFGSLALVLVTLACFRLEAGLATTAFVYLIVIVPLSLMGSILVSAILSLMAGAGLDYFFAPPVFSFRVDHPLDVVPMIAFLLTSLIATGLVGRTRNQTQAARQAEKESRLVVDTIPSLVWTALPDGSRDFHSRRWLEFTGLFAAEAAGDGWLAVFHPGDRARVADKWRSAVGTGQYFEVEARGQSAKGGYRWLLVHATPLRDESGTIVKWYGSSIDMEDRKGATEALRESEEQWREVFEHNPVMYFVVDANVTVLSVNAFGAAQLGYTVDELVGQSVLDVFFEEDRDFVQRNVGICLEELGYSNSWEVRKVRKDGTALWVRENAKAVQRAGNQLIVLIACEDITERRRAEEALRQSQMYLAEAQRLSLTGSFGWKAATGEFVWSEETFRIFGYDLAMIPSLELVLRRTHPEDRAAAQRFLELVSRDGQDWDFELRLLMPDGTVKHVHAVAQALCDASGRIEFVGAVMDVTAAKQAESRIQLIIDTVPALIWTARHDDGLFEFLSRPWLDYTGLSHDQALGCGWTSAVHPDDLAGLLECTREIRASGMQGEAEARLRRFDGEFRLFLFRAAPLHNEAGRIVKWYGSNIDIEDRKRAEVALRESEQRFRDYVEMASDWLWETGPDHRFTRVSDHPPSIGNDYERRLGRTRWDFATDLEEEPEKWRLHLATLEAHKPFRGFTYAVTRVEDGAAAYIATSGKPVFDSVGNFLGYRGVSSDVSAAVRMLRAEEALRDAHVELAHVTRVTMLGQMTASISHEVNQPLAAIVTSAQASLRWLEREPPDLGEARGAVQRIITDGARAAEVIRRVRALLHKTDVEKVPIDINSVVDEVLALVQRELFRHRVPLRKELAPSLPMVLADRVQLQQVIINLVMNGVEAMQLVSDRPRELWIASRQDDAHHVLVAVKDSGVGITAENEARLFTAFFTTKSSGMGIGLSICRSIIEAHGGRLWASRNVGPGATFQFTLPAFHETRS